MEMINQFKSVCLYTWDKVTYQVDVEDSCIFNSFSLEAATEVFNREADKLGAQYVKDLTKDNLKLAEREWEEYWNDYMKEHPDFDGFDYADERSCFMVDIFGGDAKHI